MATAPSNVMGNIRNADICVGLSGVIDLAPGAHFTSFLQVFARDLDLMKTSLILSESNR